MLRLVWLCGVLCLMACAPSRNIPAGYQVEELTDEVVLTRARQDPMCETYEFIVILDAKGINHPNAFNLNDQARHGWCDKRAKETKTPMIEWMSGTLQEQKDDPSVHWIQIISVAVAIDTRWDGSIHLMEKDSLDALALALKTYYQSRPPVAVEPEQRRESEGYTFPVSGWKKMETKSKPKLELVHGYADEIAKRPLEPEQQRTMWEVGSLYPNIRYITALIRDWQAQLGHPYSESNFVVARTWLWLDCDDARKTTEHLEHWKQRTGPKLRLIDLTK